MKIDKQQVEKLFFDILFDRKGTSVNRWELIFECINRYTKVKGLDKEIFLKEGELKTNTGWTCTAMDKFRDALNDFVRKRKEIRVWKTRQEFRWKYSVPKQTCRIEKFIFEE